MAVEQGAYLGDAAAVQVRHRLKAPDAPLKEQVHQHGLHRVVEVVAQGDLGDAQVLEGGIQATPPKFGAQRAGVFFLPLLKNDLVHRYGDAGVGHLQVPAQVRHGVKAHTRGASFQGDSVDVKRHRVKPPQLCQGCKGQKTILAAGHAHGHGLPGVDHVIVLHATAHQAQNMLHRVIPPKM